MDPFCLPICQPACPSLCLSACLFICPSSTVCSSARWTCLSSIWLPQPQLPALPPHPCLIFRICLIFIFSILISHARSSCLSRCPPANESLDLSVFISRLSPLSVFSICCSRPRSPTCNLAAVCCSGPPPPPFFLTVPVPSRTAIMPVNPLRGSARLIMCVIMPLCFLSNTMETPPCVCGLLAAKRGGGGEREREKKKLIVVNEAALNSAVSSLQYRKSSMEGARMQGKKARG